MDAQSSQGSCKDEACCCRGQLNTLQNGMVTSASLLGAVIGSAVAIFLRDKIGRKFELLLSAGCYGKSLTCTQDNLAKVMPPS